MKNKLLWLWGCIGFLTLTTVRAQEVAVKTNLLDDLTTTINLGAEWAVNPKWTIGLTGSYNPWTFSDNKKWKHWLVRPEARYWLCEKFNGHFLGAHLHGGQYNVGNLPNGISFLGSDFSLLGDYRFEGWFVGAGIGYGYSWMLGRHWNIEAEIGVGYAFSRFDKFRCPECGEKVGDGSHHYVGPTKAAVSLIYLF